MLTQRDMRCWRTLACREIRPDREICCVQSTAIRRLPIEITKLYRQRPDRPSRHVIGV
jgi:hypothetical protein